MTRWIVITATVTATHCKVYSSFATADCEDFRIYETERSAQDEAATIKRKWPYIQTFVVPLDIQTPKEALAAWSEPLPSVAGHMSMTHADFQNACLVALQDLERVPVPGPDRVITQLLCEAVRCSRECLATAAKLQEATAAAPKLTEQQHNAFPKGRW